MSLYIKAMVILALMAAAAYGWMGTSEQSTQASKHDSPVKTPKGPDLFPLMGQAAQQRFTLTTSGYMERSGSPLY